MLTKREKDILQAFMETLIPLPSTKLTVSINDARVVERIEEHIKYFANDIRIVFRLILALFDYSAIFYRLSFRTFRKMNLKQRSRYLEAWHNSSIAPKRTIWRFLDAVTYMNYYADEKVCEQIGFSPKFKQPLPIPDFPKENLFDKPFDHDLNEECDVCVIGSGAGGAVAAKVLAEAGKKVIILEEGGYFTTDDFTPNAVKMTQKLYRSGGIVNTYGWPAILVPVGKCVGGTTLINSGTCLRTSPDVFDDWVRNYGLSTWSSKRMERHYKEVENIIKVEPSKESLLQHNTKVFRRGIEKMGFQGNPLPRYVPECSGSGTCCFGCPTNAKKSTNLSYIPLALKAGAKLYTNCQASQFLYSGGHANIVIGKFKDPITQANLGTLEVKAKAIVLACGTFHTPVMLMRSHVPNLSGMIGHNLTLHPAAKVAALFDEEVRGWENEIPQGYYFDQLASEGIMLEGIFLPPPYTASSILTTGEKHREAMEHYNNMAIFGMMVHDTSRGKILRMPGWRPLTIYNINQEDLPKYKKGLTVLAEAFFASGAKKVLLPLHHLPELSREDGIDKLKSIKVRRKDLDLSAFHPLGTCRMGADPEEAVCDPYGRLYGLDNVFIADGSIFPTSLGVNPMLTIMASASKIAEYMVREVL